MLSATATISLLLFKRCCHYKLPLFPATKLIIIFDAVDIKKMATHLDLGRKGELLAKTHLEENGYEILDENWTFGKAEIDLIAYKDRVIIFTEVKTRTGNYFGEPEDFVDNRKQKLLAQAADEYIYLMDHQGEVRFDIIAILFTNSGSYSLNHIEDAFWPQPE